MHKVPVAASTSPIKETRSFQVGDQVANCDSLVNENPRWLGIPDSNWGYLIQSQSAAFGENVPPRYLIRERALP